MCEQEEELVRALEYLHKAVECHQQLLVIMDRKLKLISALIGILLLVATGLLIL